MEHKGFFFSSLLLLCTKEWQLINDFISYHLCVLVHRRTMYIWLQLAVITGDCMGHGEGNGLMSISPFLKLPPLNTPYALSTASQEQRFYNCRTWRETGGKKNWREILILMKKTVYPDAPIPNTLLLGWKFQTVNWINYKGLTLWNVWTFCDFLT